MDHFDCGRHNSQRVHRHLLLVPAAEAATATEADARTGTSRARASQFVRVLGIWTTAGEQQRSEHSSAHKSGSINAAVKHSAAAADCAGCDAATSTATIEHSIATA